MGQTQVMLVDVDHNDSDDRLAIMILAFQAREGLVGCRKWPTLSWHALGTYQSHPCPISLDRGTGGQCGPGAGLTAHPAAGPQDATPCHGPWPPGPMRTKA